jgi:Holliday junction DNA helicase RuvA
MKWPGSLLNEQLPERRLFSFIKARYDESMISFLEGKIEFKAEKFVIVNVGGVGYKVFVGLETSQKITEKGDNVKLWTHQYVREDSLELYGFIHFAELELFETLIGISGIGPKGALGILGIAPVDTLKKAIAAGDTSYLTRVSGIGRKTAEKIVLELREKMAGKGISSIEAPELREEADVMDALVQLGYSQREAREAINQVPPEIQSAEKRLKEALKKLGRKG